MRNPLLPQLPGRPFQPDPALEKLAAQGRQLELGVDQFLLPGVDQEDGAFAQAEFLDFGVEQGLVVAHVVFGEADLPEEVLQLVVVSANFVGDLDALLLQAPTRNRASRSVQYRLIGSPRRSGVLPCYQQAPVGSSICTPIME